MWDIIDIYSIHISRLFNSLHNKELIQGHLLLVEKKLVNGTLLIKQWRKQEP